MESGSVPIALDGQMFCELDQLMSCVPVQQVRLETEPG